MEGKAPPEEPLDEPEPMGVASLMWLARVGAGGSSTAAAAG